MDRETLIRSLIAAAIVLAIWFGYRRLTEMYGPPPAPAEGPAPAETPPAEPPPSEPGETPAEAPTEAPPAAPGEGAAEPTLAAPAGPALMAQLPPGEAAPPDGVVLGSDLAESPFPMEVDLAAEGAVVRRLTLARSTGFFETVFDRHEEDPNARAPLHLIVPEAPFGGFEVPELRLWLEGRVESGAVDLSAVPWRLKRTGETTAEATVDVATAEGVPLVRVRKVFELPLTAEATPPYGLRLRIEITSIAPDGGPRPARVQYLIQGPSSLAREGTRTDFRQAVAGVWSGGTFEVAGLPGKTVKDKADETGTLAVPGERVAWAGQVNKYFAVVLIPGERGAEGFTPDMGVGMTAGVTAFAYTLPDEPDLPQAGLRLVTADTAFGPEPLVHEYLVYAGPKDADLFEQPPYLAARLQELIVWTRCCIPIPGINYIGKFLMVTLEWFHTLVGNYGIAIIMLTIVLRIVLHPVTRWSRKSMSKMQTLGPKMKALRGQFGDDKQRMNEEMMRLYKEEGINPMGGCLPMFLQMPIWIALYGALLAAVSLRHAAFLPAWMLPEGSAFLQDLAQPDRLIYFANPIEFSLPLLGTITFTSFNILPILMAGSMYLQQKLQPTPTADPSQTGQQKTMMIMMTGMMLVFLYNAPSALCLYITVSMTLGFAESHYLKKHFAKENEGGGPGGGDDKGGKGPRPPKPSPYVSGKKRSLSERVRQRIAPALEAESRDKGGKGKKRR